MKRFYIVMLITSTLLFGSTRDIYIMRTAVFSTIGTYLYGIYKDSSKALIPFSIGNQKYIIITYGHEFNKKEHRELKSALIGYGFNWSKPFIEANNFKVIGKTEFNIRRWSGDKNLKKSIGYIFTLLPILEYRFKSNLYLEFGVGFSYLSSTIVGNRDKSTNFQFNDNIGFGYNFNRFSLGYRFTHISNLGIKKPNPSLDFHSLLLKIKF